MYLHATCCELRVCLFKTGKSRNSILEMQKPNNPRHKTVEVCWEKHGHPASTRAGRVGPKL